MTSRERIHAIWDGKPVDHVPLTTWCFGLQGAPKLRWQCGGVEREYWYSLRMEHIHTLPQPWTLEDDFNRARAWLSLGMDDILDVSVPWAVDPEVTWSDSEAPPGKMDARYPVLVRDYVTPAGPLRHAVRRTGEDQGPGWVVQPDCVPLFEDFNIPRAVTHAVDGPDAVDKIPFLYQAPDKVARRWFAERMEGVKAFADDSGVAVQAWAAFGMDAVVWLAGTEGAIMLALDAPESFGRLMDIVTRADCARAELAASNPGVDMVIDRGWYSSTDFWSPDLFDQFVYPHILAVAKVVYKYGKKLGYVMTTGVEILGPRLADAGVDVLYFIDPVQDRVSLERAKELLAERMTLVGGTNALTLQSDDPEKIRDAVRRALDCLGPTNRFGLHPVDAVFPDTPWRGIEELVRAWEDYR